MTSHIKIEYQATPHVKRITISFDSYLQIKDRQKERKNDNY